MYIVNLYNVSWKRKYTQEEVVKATGLSPVNIMITELALWKQSANFLIAKFMIYLLR